MGQIRNLAVQKTENIIHSKEFPALTINKFKVFVKADGYLYGITIQDGILPAPI
jgi:hypothetical protein